MGKNGYVYLTTNLVNGKQYVGQHLATEFDKMEEAKKGHTPWNKGVKGVVKTSEETKRKQSITQINHPKKSKKVYQYTLDGVFVNKYPSLHEAARKNCFDVRGISACCNAKCKSYKGFIWKHAESNLSETSLQTHE